MAHLVKCRKLLKLYSLNVAFSIHWTVFLSFLRMHDFTENANHLSLSALFFTDLSELTAFTESIDCFACTVLSSFFSLCANQHETIDYIIQA